MSSQINDFVREALLRGVSREEINRGLLESGWTPKEIHTALDAFVDCDLPLPVPRKRVSGSAKEAFLFLMLFSALYTAVFAMSSVLFDLININLPEPGESVKVALASLRYGIASIVVSFPIFLFMSRVIRRDAMRNPGQKISPVRRWLTYLTLFVASISIVTDLITLIVRYLSGDLTLRFGLKVLTVAVLAGIVLVHYLRELRRDETSPSAESRSTPAAKLAFAAMIVAVLAIVGTGFWFAGSPMKARLYAQDQQRISDLAAICSRVDLHYSNKGVLPETLEECNTDPGTFITHKSDRVTGAPYEYRVVDATHYEVGAVFNLPTPAEEVREGSPVFRGYLSANSGFWKHEAGRATFTVDVAGKYKK